MQLLADAAITVFFLEFFAFVVFLLAGTQTNFQLGDAVTVRLVEAAPFAGALRFEMLSEGTPRVGRASALKAKASRPKKMKSSARASRRRARA